MPGPSPDTSRVCRAEPPGGLPSGRWLSLGFAFAALFAPLRSAAEFLPVPAVRALALESLETGEAAGPLTFEAALTPSEDYREALVEVVVGAAEGLDDSGELRLSLILDRFEVAPVVHSVIGGGESLTARCWKVSLRVELPEDLRESALVLESPVGWGTRLAAEESPGGEGCLEETFDLRPPPEVEPDRRASPIELLPVASEVRGKHRFQVLTTSTSIQRVVFFLDEERIFEDDRPPFAARIDLGEPVATHRIRVEGLTHDGVRIGSDEIVVNAGSDRFEVAISDLRLEDGSHLAVTADVRKPADAALDRVEFYLSDELRATLQEGPFRAVLDLPQELDGTEYVRVVAYTADGLWVEGVSLLQGGQVGEQIEVHLVELFAVVTDRDGQPVPTLESEDFVIEGKRGVRYPIERFELAESVPLSIGLVIDTSESMWTLMPDTRRAAALFLSQIVTDRDTAFLVDFDTQPRLAQARTSELGKLARALGGLSADGATAMYDAVIFSSLQFDESVGRRALVMLTDGDDYQSRFSQNRAVDQARAAGAPIYLIALGGFDDMRRNLKTLDVESLTERTGGRVFYVSSMDEVQAAYRSIAGELRNQYLIAFSTDRRLSAEEIDRLELKVRRPGLEARIAVNPLR